MKRTVIRNAWVIASSPREPSRVPTDILIEGAGIVAIGEHLNVADAEIHDATGRIILPGPVNAHLHSWQTGLRGIEGARALGLADRIGTLEVGKQADLAIIDARALNLWPNNDLFATVLHACLANVEAVMIGGVWRKRDGRLLFGDLDRLFSELADSSRRIIHASGLAS